MSDIQTFRRRISPEQQQRRELILAQATRMIRLQGREVAMEAVATAANVSRTTLYRYFTSREHLLAEVTLVQGQHLLDRLIVEPPAGHTVGEKVQAMCQSIASINADNERMLDVCIHNLSSQDPAVLDSFAAIEELVSQMFTSVLRQSVPSRWLNVESVLFRYLFGSLVLATTGKISYPALAEDMNALCRSLLGDACGEPA